MRLAYWRGNASALHRELVERERGGGPPAPSLKTLHRAIRRDVPPGDLAGLREGERARRRFDVYLQRPATYRNAAWEGDHVEAPVQVDVDGVAVRPWVTWFVDAMHDVILGAAVTAGIPNRGSVLAALRASVLRRAPYGPAGGLPGVVRIDRGKDFLSATVQEALGAFAVRVVPLPAYTPYLKGTVESINGAAEEMLFAGLPRYTHRQTQINGAPVDPDQPALTFEAFVAEVLAWVDWWNTRHRIEALDGLTPLQSWLADPTPAIRHGNVSSFSSGNVSELLRVGGWFVVESNGSLSAARVWWWRAGRGVGKGRAGWWTRGCGRCGERRWTGWRC